MSTCVCTCISKYSRDMSDSIESPALIHDSSSQRPGFQRESLLWHWMDTSKGSFEQFQLEKVHAVANEAQSPTTKSYAYLCPRCHSPRPSGTSGDCWQALPPVCSFSCRVWRTTRSLDTLSQEKRGPGKYFAVYLFHAHAKLELFPSSVAINPDDLLQQEHGHCCNACVGVCATLRVCAFLRSCVCACVCGSKTPGKMGITDYSKLSSEGDSM
eukprot:1466519-Amphidinium_carterae.1